MLEKTLIVTHKTGLHARPAALLVQAASGFKADVAIVKDGRPFNAKSILAVMSAGVRQGDSITVRATGEDEQKAIAAVAALVAANFGEG